MKKRLIAVGAMLVLSSIGVAQTNKSILRLPSNSNGYLILDKYSYPTVDHWTVEISNPGTDTDGNPTTTVVYREKWFGTNYKQIPSTVYNSNSTFHVIGYDATGTVLVDEGGGLSNGGEAVPKCHIICDGSDYVYQLTNYDIPNGGYRILMEQPAPPAAAAFYYEWFTASDFNSNGAMAPKNPPTHGLNNFIYDGTNKISQYIVKTTVPQGQYYHNRFGDPINGVLYGVMKYFGPYIGISDQIGSPDLGDVCESFESMSTVLNYVNLNHSNPVVVKCEGRELHTETAETGGEVTFEPCIKDYYDNIGGIAGFNYFQVFHIPCDLFDGGDAGHGDPDGGHFAGGTGFNWPELISSVYITSVDDPKTATNEYARSDYFDEDGNFTGGNFTLPKGLLQINYIANDGSIANAFVYNSEENTTTLTQADFVSYEAYPVPVVDDNFTLRLLSSQRSSFTYELRDSNGELLYTEKYTLEKDKELDDVISPDKGLKPGSYFNKLSFTDGSVINFQIVK